ncbi:MAG TPA: histidine kinase dimerization/phospho-acceptor domain-containing protein, partial [Pseudomonadales bacterium]|nr:histidine kinase dimerization/phospho-acceptor domain-containing protein [Pseudomonadales bacterium]
MHHQRLINQTWFMHLAFAVAVMACIVVGGVLHFDKIAASDWRAVFNDLLPTFSLVLVVAFWVYCGLNKLGEDRLSALQDELKASQQQINMLSIHMPAAVFILDRNLKFANVLGQELTRLEFHSRHLIGMNLHDFLNVPETHPIIDKHRAVLAGATVREEIKLQGRVYQAILSPLTDESRVYKGVMGFLFDISEQKKAEQQLREAELRWSTMVQNVPGVIYQFRCNAQDASEGKFTYVSPKAKNIIGVDAESLLNDAIFSRIPEEDTADLAASIREAAQENKQFVREGRLLDEAGKVRWWRCQSTPMYTDESGEIIFNGILVDLTEAKQVQDELKNARELAERASRAKSDFLSTVSHEIRTPMNGIIGMSSLLLDSNLSDLQKQRVETIQSCGHSLLSLINDVLDFSKIESGDIAIEQIPFCPRNLLEDCIQSMASAAH